MDTVHQPELKGNIKHTHRIHTLIVNRVKLLRNKMRALKGGTQHQLFLQLEWEQVMMQERQKNVELRDKAPK